MSITRILLFIFAAIVATLLTIVVLARDHIAERGFERGVKQTVGIDFSESLEDGLHVFLCGTGSPMPDIKRAGPCIGVLAGDQGFVFDTGSGSVRKLQRMGFPMAKLETLYLTHLHSDHIDGLGELMLQAWIAGGRSAPLPVHGPTGTHQVVEAFNEAYRIDRGYRIAHHGTRVAIPSGYGGVAREIRIPKGPGGTQIVYQDVDTRIMAIRVEHSPVEPAFGYRIDYKDRSISISGDTVYHPGFIAASKDVDVMLHEALNPKMVNLMESALAERGQTLTAKIMFDITDYHATPEDAARAAAEANAEQLIYYHIVPPLPRPLLNRVWLGDAAKEFDGKLIVGMDGMMISLPSDSTSIQHEKRF